MANIKISQLNQYDGSDYSKVDVAGVDRQEGVNVKVNLAPVNEIKNKVSDNTVAQGLTAGFAQMLLGNETPTEQSFVYRKAGGDTEIMDGSAQYTEVMGESVVANQYVPRTKPADGSGADVTWVGGEDGSLTFNGTATSNQSAINGFRASVIAGHKYLSFVNSDKIRISDNATWQNYKSKLWDITTSGEFVISYYLTSGISFTNEKCFKFFIDLTQWYNGNVPAGLTADQFLADYPWVLGMGYNEGTIVNNNNEAIKTKDSDDTVIGEISVKPHYIEGGLKSAGSVYDSKFSDKEVQRVSVVDLSILQWTNSGSIYQTTITGIKRASDNTVAANILAEKYHTRATTGTGSDPLGIAVNTSGTIVCNTGTEGVAPSGLLIYELATPIVHEYEQAENTSLPVKANGMEEAISSTPSTPVKVMARYSIDVYQAVKDLLAASQAEPQAE